MKNQIEKKTSGEDLEGKVVIIRSKSLSKPWASGDRRFLCSGGFGCKPYLSGTAVFGKFFCDGPDAKEERMSRGDVEGIAVDQTNIFVNSAERTQQP